MTSQMRMRVDPIADEKVSETFPLLPICGQKIRLENRMRTRTMFAEFEEILIADWQYDELEIPL